MPYAFVVSWSGTFESSSSVSGDYSQPTGGRIVIVADTIERAAAVFRRKYDGEPQIFGATIDSIERINATDMVMDAACWVQTVAALAETSQRTCR